LIISFLVINPHAMGSTAMNHSDGHIGIGSVKDWLTDRLLMIYIMREMLFDSKMLTELFA
jgi:hypothetical protein